MTLSDYYDSYAVVAGGVAAADHFHDRLMREHREAEAADDLDKLTLMLVTVWGLAVHTADRMRNEPDVVRGFTEALIDKGWLPQLLNLLRNVREAARHCRYFDRGLQFSEPELEGIEEAVEDTVARRAFPRRMSPREIDFSTLPVVPVDD